MTKPEADTVPPPWIGDVTSWLVTFAEGRFGLCRMLLWFGDEEASVVMPDPEYTLIERALDPPMGSTAETLTAFWEKGLLPTSAPSPDGVAPRLSELMAAPGSSVGS